MDKLWRRLVIHPVVGGRPRAEVGGQMGSRVGRALAVVVFRPAPTAAIWPHWRGWVNKGFGRGCRAADLAVTSRGVRLPLGPLPTNRSSGSRSAALTAARVLNRPVPRPVDHVHSAGEAELGRTIGHELHRVCANAGTHVRHRLLWLSSSRFTSNCERRL
jgi:hypothetical protein